MSLNMRNVKVVLFASMCFIYLYFLYCATYEYGKGGEIDNFSEIQNIWNSSGYLSYEHGTSWRIENLREIESILNYTAYLWRAEFNTEYSMNSNRLEAQREWTRAISNTQSLKFWKPKTFFVEYPQNHTLSKLDPHHKLTKVDPSNVCRNLLPFANKCNLILSRTSDTRKEFFQLLSSGVEVDVVVTLRNAWSPRPNYKLPKGIREIVYLLEPPGNTFGEDLSINNDILASYDLHNSDIPIPYSEYEETDYKNSIEVMKPMDLKKTKLAVALISNCRSKMRLEIIKELQKYMKIDVFGKCGKELKLRDCTWGEESCIERLSKEYKFYLSFENSNCRGYITEKFFKNALSNGIVPVVIGAHPEDYLSAAPPDSYILAEEFKSLEDLAKYLKKLEGDEKLYGKYLEWRSKGRITTRAWEDFFCRACSMIFYSEFVPPPSWPTGKQILWKDVNTCLPKDKWRWS